MPTYTQPRIQQKLTCCVSYIVSYNEYNPPYIFGAERKNASCRRQDRKNTS